MPYKKTKMGTVKMPYTKKKVVKGKK